MQQGECWALGKSVNGRKADFPLISSDEEEFLCAYCVLWLFWFWISITELECCQIWEALQRFTDTVLGVSKWIKMQSWLSDHWPQLAVFCFMNNLYCIYFESLFKVSKLQNRFSYLWIMSPAGVAGLPASCPWRLLTCTARDCVIRVCIEALGLFQALNHILW